MPPDRAPPSLPETRYRPLSRRRRLLLVALAVATAVALLATMLQPQLRAMRAGAERRAAPPPPCAEGQTEGCVGGTMGVIVTPPAASASASR